MAKLAGMGWTSLTVADGAGTACNIRTGCTNLDFASPRTVQDITSIDLFAIERLLLLADFSINLGLNFDDAPVSGGISGPHWVFQSINAGNARSTTLTVAGSSLSGLSVLWTDYTVTRGNDGKLTAKAAGALSSGTAPAWT